MVASLGEESDPLLWQSREPSLLKKNSFMEIKFTDHML